MTDISDMERFSTKIQYKCRCNKCTPRLLTIRKVQVCSSPLNIPHIYTPHVNLHKVEFKLHYLIVFEGSSAVITWPFFLLDLLEQYTMCTSLMVLSLVFTQIYGQGFQLFFGTTASPSSEYLSNRIVFSCLSAVTRKSYKTDAKHLER